MCAGTFFFSLSPSTTDTVFVHFVFSVNHWYWRVFSCGFPFPVHCPFPHLYIFADSLDDEDEVLLACAEQLAFFVPLVGGGDHAHTLLPPLEALAQVEETVVHDKAVEALCAVGKEHPAAHVEEYFIPLVKKLAENVGWASRVSACSLFTTVYPKVAGASQDELRAIFAKLCEDEMPMVRRAAVSLVTVSLPPVSVSSSRCHTSYRIPQFCNATYHHHGSCCIRC